ncbi:MAG: potassium channel family protein [Wujia sp.]
MKSYVVIGLGLFGTQIALKLYEMGNNVMVIDTNAALIEEYANNVSRAVVADAKKRDVLKQLAVDRCDCAIVAMATDLSASVLITMNLKALGVPEIICKVQNETDMEVLETLGATQVIIPEKLAADRLARRLNHPNVWEYIELSDHYGIIEMEVPKCWLGQSIKSINVRAKYGVNIIAIRQNDGVNVSFAADYSLKDTDVLVLVGDTKALNKVQNVH